MTPPGDRPSALAKALGFYREFEPPEALQRHFSRVWVHVVSPSLGEPLAVVPDGHVDVQWYCGKLRIAGPDKRVNRERVPAGAAVVGFRFRPGAARCWLGLPMTSLVDQRVALGDLWGRGVRETSDALVGAGLSDVVARLGHYLQQRSRSIQPPDGMAQAIYDGVARAGPADAAITRSLAATLGISPRGLRRHALLAFGYGPKSLHRILRFQAFLRAARARDEAKTLAALAVEAGYTDQSHLCRECAEMAGMTPAVALQRL